VSGQLFQAIPIVAETHPKLKETPYAAAVAAAVLLFLAVVVPVAFLVVRKYDTCYVPQQDVTVLAKVDNSW